MILELTCVVNDLKRFNTIKRVGRGYVYLVKCEQFYKVGVSRNVQGRMLSMQCDNPFPIQLLHTIETNSMYDAEKHFHTLCQSHRVRDSEWFVLPADLAEYIQTIQRIDVTLIKTTRTNKPRKTP